MFKKLIDKLVAHIQMIELHYKLHRLERILKKAESKACGRVGGINK